MNQVILSHFGSNKHHESLNYMDGVFIHTWADLQNWPWSHGGSSEDGRTDLGRTAAAVVATSKAPAVCPNVNLPLWENSWWFLRGFFWINFKYILIYLNQFFLDLVNSLWFLFVVVALFMGESHFLVTHLLHSGWTSPCWSDLDRKDVTQQREVLPLNSCCRFFRVIEMLGDSKSYGEHGITWVNRISLMNPSKIAAPSIGSWIESHGFELEMICVPIGCWKPKWCTILWWQVYPAKGGSLTVWPWNIMKHPTTNW